MPEHNGQNPAPVDESAPAEQIEAGAVFRPNVDIVETPEELTLVVDLPGADPDRVDLAFERSLLTITAPVEERAPEGARRVLEEYAIGTYQRTFRIGQQIDNTAISAESRDGTLVVHLPKSPDARPTRIPISCN